MKSGGSLSSSSAFFGTGFWELVRSKVHRVPETLSPCPPSFRLGSSPKPSVDCETIEDADRMPMVPMAIIWLKCESKSDADLVERFRIC